MNNFVFVHIMKCGGTSLATILRKVFKEYLYRDLSFRKDRYAGIIRFTDRSEKNYPWRFNPHKHKCIMGHFTVDKYKHLGWPSITFVRRPADRIISYYSIWKHNDRMPYNGESIWTFSDFFPNCMYYMMGGTVANFKFIGILERYEESLIILENILDIEIKNKKVHRNRTPKRKKEKFSGRTKRILDERNSKDLALYEESLRRFDKMAKIYL